jgi:FKBP-type peptidyl-prolyl cis-trans isomerase 2
VSYNPATITIFFIPKKSKYLSEIQDSNSQFSGKELEVSIKIKEIRTSTKKSKKIKEIKETRTPAKKKQEILHQFST